jgi:hypothetical protein
VDDFPEVGQREYHAKTGAGGERTHRQDAPTVYHRQPMSAPKAGLLRRLANVARGKREDQASRQVHGANAEHTNEEVDLPVFFGRDKR